MDFLILTPESEVALAGGSFNIFGLQGTSETVILAQPLTGELTVTFDPSFNTGGDTVAFAGNAEDYTVRLSGTSVVISNGSISATIPAGTSQTNIVFVGDGTIEDGDLRILTIVQSPNPDPVTAVLLGDQEVQPGDTPQPLEPLDPSGGELVFTDSFSTSVEENQTAAFDADLVGDPDVVFALGGADVSLFSIDDNGVVTFNEAPDFEDPGDADGDNIYELSLSASADGMTIAQDVTITVTDVQDTIIGGGEARIATGLRDAVAPTASEENDAGRVNDEGDIVTAFGVTPAVLGMVGVDTEIEQLPASTRFIISGENQTVGAGNNNTRQLFGIIQAEDSDAGDLLLEIENAARVDGTLIVEQLIINRSDIDDDTIAPVTTLTIDSGGERDVTNVIRDIVAGETQSLVLTGTQGLGITVTDLASSGVGEILIDAEDLGGRLILGIDGAVLDSGNDDDIDGTDSAADRLALFGTLGAGTTPRVDDIENIQFGVSGPSLFADATFSPDRTVEGEFSFANVDDINNTITITNLSGPLTLLNFADDTVVNIGDGTGGSDASINQFNDMIGMTAVNNTIILNGADSRDDITVNITPFLGGDAGGLLNGPATDFLDPPSSNVDFIDINGFRNIDIIVSRQATLGTNSSDYAIDLRLDDGFGVDLDASGLSLDADVDEFVTDSGSDFDAVAVDGALEELTIFGGETGRRDELDVGNAILGSISIIDISNFHGTFTATVVNAVDVDDDDVDSANVDRTFIIGDDDVNITLQEFRPSGATPSARSIDTNTTFLFTDPTPTSGDVDGTATWTITNFVISDPDESSLEDTDLSNFSRLDLGGLGLSSFTELVIEPDGSGNTIITADDANWEIILIDVDPAELVSDSENFLFTGTLDSGANDNVAIAPVAEPAMGMMESFAFA
ncbi:MAG: cadherin repeat domain-containing protein [Pseudomonadota bacterium]